MFGVMIPPIWTITTAPVFLSIFFSRSLWSIIKYCFSKSTGTIFPPAFVIACPVAINVFELTKTFLFLISNDLRIISNAEVPEDVDNANLDLFFFLNLYSNFFTYE